MNDRNLNELMNAPVYDKMPECAWTTTGLIRCRIVHYPANKYPEEQILEMLYADGFERLFWCKLPVFHELAAPEPKVTGWRRFLPEAFQ